MSFSLKKICESDYKKRKYTEIIQPKANPLVDPHVPEVFKIQRGQQASRKANKMNNQV